MDRKAHDTLFNVLEKSNKWIVGFYLEVKGKYQIIQMSKYANRWLRHLPPTSQFELAPQKYEPVALPAGTSGVHHWYIFCTSTLCPTQKKLEVGRAGIAVFNTLTEFHMTLDSCV